MSEKVVKPGEAQVPLIEIDTTVATVSTSQSATKSYTFEKEFAEAPTVLSCYVNDGTKNRRYKEVTPASVSTTGLEVQLQGNDTLTDDTVILKIVVYGKRS